MTDVLDLRGNLDTPALSGMAVSTKAQLLDAIERELAALSPGYADNALKLAEAYSKLAQL